MRGPVLGPVNIEVNIRRPSAGALRLDGHSSGERITLPSATGSAGRAGCILDVGVDVSLV